MYVRENLSKCKHWFINEWEPTGILNLKKNNNKIFYTMIIFIIKANRYALLSPASAF